jgi:iron(III) transport system ATP-binding protein
MSASVAVELEAVEKAFGGTRAVDRLSLRIPAGELVTLLGPSGCGKTTTLRMIAGLEQPSAGRVLIGGRDVTAEPPHRRDVSMVFQSYALFPHLSVRENVAYGLLAAGQRRPEALARAAAGLERVGLGALGDRAPSALSGGQQQRVALARALVLEPRVLLFDEPLSNLDPALRRQLRDEIRALKEALGFTAVYVTHDREEALSVSDRIVLLDHGRIAQEGPPEALYEAPRTAFVARFMGEATILPAEVREVREGRARVSVGGLALDLPAAGRGPGPAALAVRPGAVRLSAAGDGLPGTVLRATYLGEHHEYRVETPAGELFVIDRPEGAPWRPGSEVRVALAGRGLALVEA